MTVYLKIWTEAYLPSNSRRGLSKNGSCGNFWIRILKTGTSDTCILKKRLEITLHIAAWEMALESNTQTLTGQKTAGHSGHAASVVLHSKYFLKSTLKMRWFSGPSALAKPFQKRSPSNCCR
jgi:hypothetical protein